MEVRSLGFRTDLAILARSGSTLEDRGDHLVVHSPHNREFWWGNFVLVDHMPAPQESEQWLEVFARDFPEARHVAIGFDAPQGEAADLAWFALQGFEADANSVMTATALRPPRSLNRQAVCRPLTTDDDWDQSLCLRLRTNERPVDDEIFRQYVIKRIAAERGMVAQGGAAWFGAFLEGHLVSQLGLVGTGDGLARYQQVETDPDHRRKGLAGTLVHHAGTWGLTDLGAGTLVIVAEPDYVAIDLYRKLGFEVTEAQLGVARPPADGPGAPVGGEPATTL